MEADPQTRKGNGIPTPVPSSVGEGGTVSAGDALVETRIDDECLGHVHATGGLAKRGLDVLDRFCVLGTIHTVLRGLQAIHIIDACKYRHGCLRKLACTLEIVVLQHDVAQTQHGLGLTTCIAPIAEDGDTLLASLHSFKVESTVQEHAHHRIQHCSLSGDIAGLGEEVLGRMQCRCSLLHIARFLLHGGHRMHGRSLLGLVTKLLVECHGLFHLLGSKEAVRWGLDQICALNGAVDLSHSTLLTKLCQDGQSLFGNPNCGFGLLERLVDSGECGQRHSLTLSVTKLAEEFECVHGRVHGLFKLLLVMTLFAMDFGHHVHGSRSALFKLHITAHSHGL
mmetsp:Transcript_31399/g.72836  ORF Transcript_31399/g.72836 Transcript_31399/m.72836 type:complete len:338 (-) Transcript_31399:221-1234(-)